MSFYTFDIKNLLKVMKRMKLIKQFQKNLINWQKKQLVHSSFIQF